MGVAMTTNEAEVVRRFEDMAPGERADAAQAASRYLLDHDFASLQDASDDRGVALQELWDEIMTLARLPACSVPIFAFAD
jgi:hypothetical protein